MTSPLASATGLPFSQVMRVVRSSAFSIMRSYHLRSSLERSRPVLVRKVSKAVAAAAMAASVSAAENSGHDAILVPVAGSVMVVSFLVFHVCLCRDRKSGW